MYHATHSMSPRLSPSQYFTAESYREDLEHLRRSAWHLVGTTSQFSRPGDHVATTILEVPVLVRNCDGQLVGFRNVCAHRHCQLFDDGAGHSEALKCRYHGWHYGADGLTRRLPGAMNFPGFDRESHKLETFDVACCGQLVFVKLHPDAPDLPSWLGPYEAMFRDSTTADRWIENLSTRREYQANWKIPIEGSLESYHLNEVHAGTFGSDPGEQASEHQLCDQGTMFLTNARGESLAERLEAWSIRFLTGSFDSTYRHIHLFPNLMASLTESITLVYQIQPLAAERSDMRVIGFGRAAERTGLHRRCWSFGMRRASAKIAAKILDEDAAIFPRVQIGKRGAVDNGIFGRCEERLDAFHRYENGKKMCGKK